MILLRRSWSFGPVLFAAVLSLTCATTQEEASASSSPHTIEDVSTIGASSGGGVDANGIDDSGGRLVVIPFALSVHGQRGVPRMVWSPSPSPLLRALSSGLATDAGSPVGGESSAWPPPSAALYRGVWERAARARAAEVEGEGEEAGDDTLWPAPRDTEADFVYDGDGDGEDATSAEEEEPGVADYDAAEDPADESMQAAENIIFRPMFRYRVQQAARRRSYRSKASRRRSRPRRRHYSRRKYPPYYSYNYYYPYNYYGQYSTPQV